MQELRSCEDIKRCIPLFQVVFGCFWLCVVLAGLHAITHLIRRFSLKSRGLSACNWREFHVATRKKKAPYAGGGVLPRLSGIESAIRCHSTFYYYRADQPLRFGLAIVQN